MSHAPLDFQDFGKAILFLFSKIAKGISYFSFFSISWGGGFRFLSLLSKLEKFLFLIWLFCLLSHSDECGDKVTQLKTSLYFCFTRAQYPTALITRFSKPSPYKETTRIWPASQPLTTSRSRTRTLSSFSPFVLLLNHSSTSPSLQLSFEYW